MLTMALGLGNKHYYAIRVIAFVSGTIGRPRPDRPFEGSFTIHSEISPMASSVYEAGR